MTKGVFITGTGTDVGKTYAAGLLLKKLRESGRNAGYYKAAASGNERLEDVTIAAGDAREVCRLSGLPDRPESLISYLYETAVSPHLAAKLEGGPVSLEKVAADFAALSRRFDVLVAEGSGGIVCPIRWDDRERILLEDVIQALALPIVIVADAGLGTINHTVLTVAYARSKGLDPRGIILNRYEASPFTRDNRAMIEELTGVRVIGTIAPNANEIEAELDGLLAAFAPVAG